MEKVQILKQEKGITLIVLAVSVIVLAILAVTVAYNGTSGLDTASKQAFISELQMVQAKVNTIYEKRKISESDKRYYDAIGRDISYLNQTKLNEALGGTPREGFKYYMPEDLERLELSNITQAVLINYDTREVISYEGLEIDGKKYYKLAQISDYLGRNITQEDSSATVATPSFTLESTKLETSKWKITIKNVKYSSDSVGLASVKYKLSTSSNWMITNQFEIEVTKAGQYEVKVIDTAGKEKTVQITI